MVRFPPPPGRLVAVGPRQIHVRDSGVGTPVVFEAGSGGWSSHWERVIELLAGEVRTIAYDRAGLGWSASPTGCRSAAVLAEECLALLDAIHVTEPFVLVGHSYGALIARLIADRVPGRVRGVVFVDGWHESFAAWERTCPPLWSGGWLMKAVNLLDRLGVFRLLRHVLPTPRCPWPLSASTWSAIIAISVSRRYVAAIEREATSYKESDAAVGHLGVPVIALVAKEMAKPEHLPSGYPVAAHNAAWRDASSRLGWLSADAEVRLLDDTDHMIPLVRPDAVVRAVADVLQRAKCGARTAEPSAAPDRGGMTAFRDM
jgi:pimeloyl-ACP methyl ester carboxylesterase